MLYANAVPDASRSESEKLFDIGVAGLTPRWCLSSPPYISYSIARRSALAHALSVPGLVTACAGFFGALIVGLSAASWVHYLKKVPYAKVRAR